METTALFLSRIQFAFTVGFHIIFPTLTIGLSIYIAWLEGMWLKKRDSRYRQLAQFWTRLFALTFGMGVVSGIVLSYEFGTNFSRFSTATGNVLGPLLSYEVLTAFFMEAGFLGVMLFGWNRVGPRLHYTATVLVALGTVFSAFWILSANSWMQTPAGTEYRDGVFYVTRWFEVIFNPSFPYRLAHMLLASLITTTFFVAGVSAWYLLKHRHGEFAVRALRPALLTAALLTPLQLLVGDLHGLNAYEHQPMKVAAMEGRWQTEAGAPLLLLAIPNQKAARNDFELGIPYGASLILEHDPDGVVRGLREVPPDERPPVAVVFYAFRLMVGIGLLMIALSWYGVWLDRRDRLHRRRGFLRGLVWMAPAGLIATLAGWLTAEVGRQPWLVHGLYRTAEGGSPLATGQVAASLAVFGIVYSALFAAWLLYMLRLIGKGPDREGRPDDTRLSQPAFKPMEGD